jgi:signal transduction histidine kinase
MFRIFFFIILLFIVSCEKQNVSQDKLITSIEKIQDSTRRISDTTTIKLLLEKGYRIATGFTSDTLQLKYKRKIACEYYNNEIYHHYYDLTKENLQKAKSIKDSSLTAVFYTDLGDYFQNKFQFDSAYFNYRKALTYYKTVNKYQILTNYEIARLLSKESLHVESEIIIFQNLKNALQYGDPEIIHNFYVVLGINYFELSEFDLAINSFNKAFTYIDKIEIELIKNIKKSYKSQYFLKVGNVYKKKQDYIKARHFYNLGLEQLNDNENKFMYSNLIREIEELNFIENKSLNIANCNKALEISREQKYEDNIVYTLQLLANYYFKNNNRTKGFELLEEALLLAKKNRFQNAIIEIYHIYSQYDKENENRWLKEIIYLKKDILQKERTTRNKFAKIAFETESVHKNFEKLNQTLKTTYIIFIFLVIISTLIFYIHIKRRNNKILRLDKLQKQANIEVYDLLIEQQDILEKGKKIEKSRIARELHDNIVSELYGLRMNAEISAIKKKNLNEEIDFIAQKLMQIEENARNISHDLMHVSVGNKKLINIIMELLKQYKSKNDYLIHFSYNENIEDSSINNHLKINLYRIIQESLKNIDKYAKASEISILLQLNNKKLSLEITDNGIGFDPKKVTFGIGINNIKTRTLECNGNFHLESKENEGTKITCYFYNI